MRLIDRSELLDKFNLECKTAQERYMALINAPTISAVPVVRCRDCKWFNHYTMECESDDVATDHEGGASFSLNFGPDDFCSYGQRKEGCDTNGEAKKYTAEEIKELAKKAFEA